MPIKPTNKREVRSFGARELRVGVADNGSKTVEGYAVVYNALSVDLGGYVETIAPGALTRTLKDNPDVLCLRDHDPSLLMGRTTASTLVLTEDQTGLYFRVNLPKTSAANDLAESIDREDINTCSFGFVCVNDTWTQDAQGNVIRTLLDVDLFEVSVVSFAAYSATSASLRSAPREIRSAINAKVEHRDDDTACLCPCAECQDGDCADCSDADCNCDGCDCDQDELASRRSWQQRMELRLRYHALS